jgi:hypothetical protein
VLSVLQWWPFRVILWVILAIAATRFCLTMGASLRLLTD